MALYQFLCGLAVMIILLSNGENVCDFSLNNYKCFIVKGYYANVFELMLVSQGTKIVEIV